MTELIITSPAFENGGLIPVKYTGYGEDISPELHLSAPDESAKSIAIIMDDVDHPIPFYNHWLIWNIPVTDKISSGISYGAVVTELNGAKQGRGYGKNRYRGPKPPFNWSHRYQFNVYTLDCTLDLPETSRKRDLINAMDGHIIQQGLLVGHYR